MDHHCPWINNCVGFYNRKYFMLLLIYVLLSTYMVAASMALPVYGMVMELYARPSLDDMRPFLQVGAYALDLLLAGVLTTFFRFHVVLVCTNSTTIETMDKSTTKKGEFRRSLRQNWYQVFGVNPWLWPLPIIGRSGRPLGDGVMWHQESSHPDEDIPNNESDRRSSTLTASRALPSRAVASPVREPLHDTAPVNRLHSPN